MRKARDFAVGGVRPYHSPDRPRVADPGRRKRIAGYLAGGTPVAGAYRTDGVWVWPQRFVREITDHGLAPEVDMLDHMARYAYEADTPEHDADLEREARAAARAEPPRPSAAEIVYYVRVEDDDFPPDAPLSLLRRVCHPNGFAVDEALWRDLNWHPTHAFATHADEYDLREVTEAHAAMVLDRWCAKWHEEWRKR
jgi:hypothetical protein